MSDLTLNADVKLNISTGSTKGIRKQLETDLTSNPIKVKLDVEGTSEATKKVKESVSKLRAEAAKLRFDGDFFKQQDSLLKNMGLDNAQMQAARTQLNQLQTKYNEFISAFNSGDAKQTTSTFKTLWGEFGKYTAATTNLREGVTALNRELQNSAHINNAANSLQNYFDKFKQGIQGNTSLMTQFQHIQSGISSGAYAGKAGWDQLTADIATFKRQCQEAGVETQTLKQKLSNLFNQHFATAFVMAGIAALRTALRQVYQNVVELDAAVVDLQIASGKSRTEVQGLITDYSRLGKEIGATTSEVAKSADTFLRQGKTLQESQTLIKNAMMLSKLGQIDSEDAAKNLTSAMKGYNVSVEDSIGIVDRLVKVDMSAAISAGDIATAMAECAVGADVAGVSMDKLVGYIARVGETTQDGAESVGTFYRTLFSRMGNIRAGELYDPINSEDLSDTERVLNGLGIKLRSSAGEFRDFDEVLDEVARNWDNYTTVQQRAVAVAFSGTRQQEKFLVLMQGYDDALKYAGVSAESAGTAMEKYGAYMGGLESHLNSLKASFESLSINLLDSDSFKVAIDIITALTSAFDRLISTFGTLPVVISGIGIGSLAKNFGKPNDGLEVPVWYECAA